MADKVTATKPSPTELAALEHAFATDPTSDAYLALGEAYLAHGRFMEAMVVCKKGVKAHPDSVPGHLLLARIHAAQGKDKKALEELKVALEVAPTHLDVLGLAVGIHARAGEKDAASILLREAIGEEPNNDAIRAIAAEHGIELPAPPPVIAPVAVAEPEPVAPVAEVAEVAAPVAAPVEPAAAPAAPPVIAPAAPPVIAPAAAAPPVVAPPAPVTPSVNRAPASQPAAVVKFGGNANAGAPQQRPADLSHWAADDDEPSSSRGGGRRGLMGLVATFAILSVVLGGWYGFTRWRAARDREIDKLLTETNDEIRKDTYASYKSAAAAADRILELDSSNYVANAYLAYVNVLRWGEQGEGDDFKRRAAEALEKAKKAGETHGRIVAAEAYIRFFNGDARGAEGEIDEVLASGQKSGLLYTTLGTIQMWAGDLDKAAASLKQAQLLEPNSVRVLSSLGQLNRRRGMDADAWTFYDSALRIDKDHADSLLGKALLILDANEVDRPKAEKDRLLKEAEDQIAKVLGLPDGSISARQLALAKFARAQLLFAQGGRDEAAKLEQEAFTLDPANPDIRLMRGRRLLREGDTDGAVKEIRQAIAIDGKRASFYVDLSQALLAKQGGAREAVDALDKAIASFPNSSRIHVLLGDAWRAVPDIDKARASYEKAIEVEGGKLPEARAKLGQIWREKREYAKAREELEKAVKEFGLSGGPNQALALTELGRTIEEGPQPDVREAFDRYAKATRVSEGYAPAWYFLARISAGQKDREQRKQAAESLDMYLKLAPKGEYADQARELLAGLR